MGNVLVMIAQLKIIRGSNSGARRYHRRDYGAADCVSLGHTSTHSDKSPDSGGPPLIDPCSSSETRQTTVDDKPPHKSSDNSLEPFERVIHGKIQVTKDKHFL